MSLAMPKIQTLEEYEAEICPILYPPPSAYKSKYGMLLWSELDRPGEEMEWLIDDFLTTGDKSIIGGPSASGKSFLAIEAGMCIARGVPFFGHPVKQGLIVYQAGEGARGIKNRLRAYRKHHNISKDDNIPFVLLQSRVDLFSEEGDTKPLIEEIQAIRQMFDVPLRAIIIDTLAKAQGFADENSGKDMGRVLDNIDKIREATGVALCLVHHLNAEGTKLRGHTSVFANIDQVLGVISDKETKVRTVKTSKMKDGNDDLTLKFELMSVPLGEDKNGKEITSCVCLPLGEKEELRKVEDSRSYFPRNETERIVMRALFSAISESGLVPDENSRIPKSVGMVVHYDVVKAEFKRKSLPNENEAPKAFQQRISQSLKRARERLEGAGAIGVDAPYVWFGGRVVSGVRETYPSKQAVPLKPIARGNDDDDDFIPF